MKKYLGIAIFVLLITNSCALAAEKAIVEERIKKQEVSFLEGKKGKIDFSSYYEYSWIKQGVRKGQWRLFTNRLNYSVNNQTMPYLEVNSHDRFHDKDYIINTGAYFKFNDKSYLHPEIGFGGDISYVYRFQTMLEYSRRLINNYFWQFGYRYLNYSDNDVFTIYPGLVYYFDNNYLTAFYNLSSTQSRGRAQSGMVKGNFSINKSLNFWLGVAAGERLYDVEVLDANEQNGYIAFAGLDFKIYKGLKARLGYSYSKERPSFIKRSLDYGLSIRF